MWPTILLRWHRYIESRTGSLSTVGFGVMNFKLYSTKGACLILQSKFSLRWYHLRLGLRQLSTFLRFKHRLFTMSYVAFKTKHISTKINIILTGSVVHGVVGSISSVCLLFELNIEQLVASKNFRLCRPLLISIIIPGLLIRSWVLQFCTNAQREGLASSCCVAAVGWCYQHLRRVYI